MNQGWECPKCCAVMSPFHPTCWYCKPIPVPQPATDPIPIIRVEPTMLQCLCNTSAHNNCPIHGVVGL